MTYHSGLSISELAVLGASALQPGDPERVGRYDLLGVLGSGGMGRVYLGAADGGLVAVKVIRPELADDPRFRRRFAHELATMSRLDSPFTVKPADAEADATRPWMATEYVPGVDLDDAVVGDRPLPPDSVRRVAAGIATALVAIHEAGVIHRDLKPSNVILALDAPRLIDFGVAHAANLSQLTVTGQHVGTPAYMAPEQARSGTATPAADIFALGGLIVFAATGRPPFGEGSATEVLFRVVYEEPDLAGLEAVDPGLHQLASRCLDKDPGNRPDARELAALIGTPAGLRWPDDLESRIASRAAIAGSPAVGAVPGSARTEPAAPDRDGLPRRRAQAPPHRRRPWVRRLAIAVALLLTAGGGAGALLLWPRASDATAVSTVATVRSASPVAGPSPVPSPPDSAAPVASSAAIPSRPAPSSSRTSTDRHTAADIGRVTPAQLGAPDFNGYCTATSQGSAHLTSNNAYGWACTAGNGTGDDAQAVCRWTYHTSQVANRVADFNNPSTWQCWRSNGELGRLDFSGYCRSLGLSGAHLIRTDAYGWYCVNSSQGIDTQSACRWQYGSNPPISRFQNFYDSSSWQCWG